MNGNPVDDQIIQEIIQEVNGFTAAINQTRIGFVALFAQVMNKLSNDYKNRGLIIQNQQMQITNMEKELETLRGKS